jgi:excisionase family DNA binding protein
MVATAKQQILTISDVAELLKVHPITVYRLIKQAKLPVFRIGRVLRFDANQLEDWLRVTERSIESKPNGRKHKGGSSAEYLAYAHGEIFSPEKLLETLAISRPLLIRPYVEAKRKARKPLVCERCRQPRKPIAALLLFASEQAKRQWKKAAMPFCRTCFVALRKLATNDLTTDASGRTALEAASKNNRRQKPARRTKSR